MKFFARKVFLLINFFTRALQHFSFGFVVVVVFFYRYCVDFFLKTFSFFLFLFYCSSNVLKQLMERLNVLRETICCSFDGWNFQNSERNGSVWRERWTRSRTVVIYLLEFPLEFFEEFYILHIFEFIRLLILYLDGIESPKHFFFLKILKNNERLSRFVLDLK